MSPLVARRLAALSSLALLVPVTACTGSGPDEPGAGASSTTAGATSEVDPTAEPVPTKHLVGVVAGRLPGPGRKRLLRRVSPVLDQWLDEAFTAGSFPREVTGAWDGFTAGAARRARRDRDLTSLAGISTRIDGVQVTKRAVRYNVLSPRGRPVGVTARLTLDLRTTGEVSRKVSVRGRVLLTPVGDKWRVFAYDLTRGQR